MPEIHDELERARADLERFARGLHPGALERGGLAAALEELAAASTLPIELVGRPRRFAPALEATAYFVAAEALANAAKHSGAARVRVELIGGDARFTLRVADDGRGGADPRGGGLLVAAPSVQPGNELPTLPFPFEPSTSMCSIRADPRDERINEGRSFVVTPRDSGFR